ncbi:MAG TPA: DUF4398 domain-containing protein [Gammaproteobacteria bacterium]|nr:DUF4398 domain-containing protein [Gammaproteobacteria bacterium]
MRLWGFAAVLVFLVSIAGCASAPVQAMSNARQAVHAAEVAGAARYAPRDLAAARRWLDDAQFALDGGDYGQARASANKAADEARAATDKARARAGTPAAASAPVTQSAPVPASGS